MTNISVGVKPTNDLAKLVFLDLALQINDFHQRGLLTDGVDYWRQRLDLSHHDRKQQHPRCGDLYITQSKSGYDGRFVINVFASEKTYQRSGGSIFSIVCTDELMYYKPIFKRNSSLNKASQHLFDFSKKVVEVIHGASHGAYINPDLIYAAMVRDILSQKEPYRPCNIGVDYDEKNGVITVRNNKASGTSEMAFSITFKKPWGLEG